MATIKTLKSFSIKPSELIITELDNGKLVISYSFNNIEFTDIETSRGEQKQYKTYNAVMSDLQSLYPQGLNGVRTHVDYKPTLTRD